ncbi:hypothetical protein MNB_SUP05-9-280 [hydrothermal vent metagenome]|uniref:Uncharacterized protein n=1 Tax=hydrothermal vent metagenome TaxID=652676 RepID=A0A1W1DWV4_9ZZZZ
MLHELRLVQLLYQLMQARTVLLVEYRMVDKDVMSLQTLDQLS